MLRLFILIVGSAALVLLAIWLKHFVSLDIAIGIVGLIGTAAAVASLVEEKKGNIRPHFVVSEAWIELKTDTFFGYKFRATIVNPTDQPDVLLRIDHQLYHRRLGFIRSLLTCGASEIGTKTGHVLPIECKSRITYEVTCFADVPVIVPAMNRMLQLQDWDNYVLRCTFRFSSAKPITVRVTRNGLVQKTPITLAFKEFSLRIKTRKQNPMRTV